MGLWLSVISSLGLPPPVIEPTIGTAPDLSIEQVTPASKAAVTCDFAEKDGAIVAMAFAPAAASGRYALKVSAYGGSATWDDKGEFSIENEGSAPLAEIRMGADAKVTLTLDWKDGTQTCQFN
jgi:hypothetical protein